MMGSVAVGACAAGALVAGLMLAVTGWRRARRPALDERVTPYLRDVLVMHDRQTRASGTWLAWVRSVAWRAADAMGSAEAVRRRLDRLGSMLTVQDFRLRQLRWTAVAAGVVVTLCLALAARRQTSPIALLVLCGCVVMAALWWSDHDLTRRVEARERSMLQEFPTIADMLALAVAAGESPAAAVQRVATMAHGDLADELQRVIGEVHSGSTIAQAFDALAARTGVLALARFAEALATAVERGTPLVDVLHAQADDVRESARRSLIETGGRREVLMMVPVVFAILPVTVVFAFYPGLVGLNLVSGS